MENQEIKRSEVDIDFIKQEVRRSGGGRSRTPTPITPVEPPIKTYSGGSTRMTPSPQVVQGRTAPQRQGVVNNYTQRKEEQESLKEKLNHTIFFSFIYLIFSQSFLNQYVYKLVLSNF